MTNTQIQAIRITGNLMILFLIQLTAQEAM